MSFSKFQGLGKRKRERRKGKSLKSGRKVVKKGRKVDKINTRKPFNPVAKKKRKRVRELSPVPGPSNENRVPSPIDSDEEEEEEAPALPLEFSTPEYEVKFAGNRNIGLTEKLRVSFDLGTIQERIYSISFKQALINKKIVDIMGQIELAIRALLDRLRNHFGETDLVRICVIAPQFHIPHKLDLQPLGELNVKQIVDLLDNLLQSDEEILLTQGFQIHIGVARNPLGLVNKAEVITIF